MSQEEIYDFLKSHPKKKFRVTDIEKVVTGCARNTLNVNLRRIIKSDDIHRERTRGPSGRFSYVYWYDDIYGE